MSNPCMGESSSKFTNPGQLLVIIHVFIHTFFIIMTQGIPGTTRLFNITSNNHDVLNDKKSDWEDEVQL